MTFLNFKNGRQGTGYKVATLASFKIPIGPILGVDVHVIKYPKGSYIPAHTDRVPEGQNHHRLNIILQKAIEGGKFMCVRIKQFGRFIYFRPDLYLHSVTPIKSGTRYIFSIGWVTKKK